MVFPITDPIICATLGVCVCESVRMTVVMSTVFLAKTIYKLHGAELIRIFLKKLVKRESKSKSSC